MTDKPDNQPVFAFPHNIPDSVPGIFYHGMTLRDYVAAQAIPALIARHRADVPWTDIPRIALDIADAFLVERVNREDK